MQSWHPSSIPQPAQGNIGNVIGSNHTQLFTPRSNDAISTQTTKELNYTCDSSHTKPTTYVDIYLPLLGPLMSQQLDCFLLDGDLGLGDRGDREEARDMALVGDDVVI